MRIFNDPSYSGFISKVRRQLDSGEYDELFKNCRGFLKKYDKSFFDYFLTIEERYHAKSEPTIDVVDDLINFLDNITSVYNSDVYKIEAPQMLSLFLILAILSYMFVSIDISMETYEVIESNPEYFEYIPLKINSNDSALNGISIFNMNSDLGYIKSKISINKGYTDTTEINDDYSKSLVLIDDEVATSPLYTSIKDLFYSGRIKKMSRIKLINIDSMPLFSCPQIPKEQIVNSIEDIFFNPYILNQQDFGFYQTDVDLCYVTDLRNRKNIILEITAFCEEYEYIIETETDSFTMYTLIA